MTKHKVSVSERGQTNVTHDTWAILSGDASFRRLLERGILSAVFLPSGGVRLQGACYVGWAQCAGVAIDIREKVPGALKVLLSYATNETFRIEQASSPASDLGPLAVLLIRQFLLAVTEYVSRSREFVYKRQRRIGALAGGRLDVAGSIQLRARGWRHLLAFEKNVVVFNTPLNRVVLAALMQVEHLAGMIDLRPEDVAMARGLAQLFSDCRDSEVLFGDRSRLMRTASDIAESGQTQQQKDIAALASALLAHESFELRTETWSEVPRCWFLNLENLFEQAVISQLRQVVSSGTTVAHGGERPQAVFRHEACSYQARPDVVVLGVPHRVVVGDVKYKNWSGAAVASDVYQLLVHTAAFSGTSSFLAYPYHEYQATWLGEAVTDTDTWLFALDVRNLTDSITRMASVLGISTSAAESVRGAAKSPTRFGA